MISPDPSTKLLMPGEREAHVWSVYLPEVVSARERYEATLSNQEREKAQRFVYAEDRLRYTVAHGILRELIGRYLETDPCSLNLIENEFGKPELSPDGNGSPLRFNSAHSADVIVLGFTHRRSLGIDIEKVRLDLDVMELALSQFTTGETEELRRLPAKERQAAFFRCWTRKEAYIKALGLGLNFGLNKFAVTLGAEQPVRLTWSELDSDASIKWTMYHLDLYQDYVGALVVQGEEPIILSYRRWVP